MYICTVTIKQTVMTNTTPRAAKRTFKTVRVGDFSVTAILFGKNYASFYGNIPELSSDTEITREMLRKHVEQYI